MEEGNAFIDSVETIDDVEEAFSNATLLTDNIKTDSEILEEEEVEKK